MISAETTAHAAHSWSEVLMPERTDPWFGRIHTLFPRDRLRYPRIERTIRGLSRKARIHALRSAIHGLSPILGLRTTYTWVVVSFIMLLK